MENKGVWFREQRTKISPQIVRRDAFVDFLVRNGLAKNSEQAILILLGTVAVCFALSLWLFNRSGDNRPFTAAEMRVLENAGSPMDTMEINTP